MMLILNLYSALCQLYLNELEETITLILFQKCKIQEYPKCSLRKKEKERRKENRKQSLLVMRTLRIYYLNNCHILNGNVS